MFLDVYITFNGVYYNINSTKNAFFPFSLRSNISIFFDDSHHEVNFQWD